jgi:hypothetical protein
MLYHGESPKSSSQFAVNLQMKNSIYMLPPWQEMPAFARERLPRSLQNHPDIYVLPLLEGGSDSGVTTAIPKL